MMSDSDVLIPVGKIIATHGVKGLLKVHSYSGNLESLRASHSITIKSREGTESRFELKSIVPHSGKFMIGLKGLDDINLAQPLVGSEICLLRSHLPEPEDD